MPLHFAQAPTVPTRSSCDHTAVALPPAFLDTMSRTTAHGSMFRGSVKPLQFDCVPCPIETTTVRVSRETYTHWLAAPPKWVIEGSTGSSGFNQCW